MKYILILLVFLLLGCSPTEVTEENEVTMFTLRYPYNFEEHNGYTIPEGAEPIRLLKHYASYHRWVPLKNEFWVVHKRRIWVSVDYNVIDSIAVEYDTIVRD